MSLQKKGQLQNHTVLEVDARTTNLEKQIEL